MRGKKFISLTLSTMLCLQLLPTASFAAAPATDTGNAGLIAEGDYAIAGNGVRVTYDADGQTITLYRTEGSGLIQMSKPSPLGGPVVGGQEVQDFSHISCDVEQSTSGVMGSGQRMTITSQSMSTGLIRTYVLETSDSGTAKEEYEKWLGIADTVQLQKGRFIGDLYSYGFDPYETYVVEKDGVMYYAFYKDGSKYSPTGYPDIELKGLDPNKMYRIVDYVNDRVVATNLMGDNAVFNTRFSDYLLVKAVEISEPDPEPVDPDYGFTSVDDRDEALIYTGTWHDDNNASFSEGTARYTNSTDASVVFSFTGTSIRWYGQRDTNFGTAEVYLDDELKTTVDANGAAEAGVCLFEALDLPAAEHTIKIVCKSGVIDIDRFAYEAATLEPIYEKVDALSDRITYVGNWEEYHNSEFYMGNAMRTDEAGAYAELTFRGTAVRLYAEMSFNFGTADVYLDGELVENIILYGQEATGQLMFERTGLEEGEHTIRLVQNAWNINLDYISYLPEQDQPTPPETTVTVDAMDAQLVYTGVWNDDYHDVFQEGTARYAISAGASVEFEFTGSEIRWYGQNDSNFGVASVYIDNEFVQQVNVNGAAAVGKLLFQKTDLPAGSHTIRIVCDTPVIDLDYLTYTTKA